MSLHALATDMASKGRNGDSMLVHMTPGEVAGLHALALKHGGSLTINPDTGLPEAGFLKSLLPMLAGFALGPAGFGLVSSGLAAGAVVGGITGLATGSLSKGLMAGLGAYGGFGIGESLAGLGAGELAQGQISANMPTLAEGASQAQIADYTKQVNDLRTAGLQGASQLPMADKLSAGFSSATASPTDALAFAKNNFKPLAAAAAPIMADMMVPTTTKAPTSTDTGYIRQKIWDGRQFVDVGPVKASDWGSRNFSDVFTGRNYNAKDGGIVALAGGGMPGYAGATDGSVVQGGGLSAADAQKLVEAQYATIGRTGVGEGAAQIDTAGLKNWTDALVKGDLKAEDLGSRFGTSVTDYMAQNPTDQYTQYVKNYQANQAGTGANATTGGVADLATTGNTAATVDTSGIATLNNTGATAGGTSLADAQAQVNNMYRTVLGRDADPEGLKFWSSAIASGRPADSVYQDFLTSARANTELVNADQIKNKTFTEATTPYKGYTSTDTSTIADEWVRNVLGRDPTAADKAQSWYQDTFDKMRTQNQAKALYNKFTDYAKQETGKDVGLNWMAASQLKALPEKKVVTPPTTEAPYINAVTPGDIKKNADGTTTITPNIPGRPDGGFPGMGAVKDVYTQGGGSLGYTSPTFNTIEDFNAKYLDRMGGDSRAAYDYLTGKGGATYPVKSGVGQISKPYDEEVMGYPARTNVPYTYDKTSGKMVANPDYIAPSRDTKGNVTYGMSTNDIKKYLSDTPLSGQALYDWAQTNGVSAQQIADSTGRKLSDVYADFRVAAKKAAAKVGTGVGESGTYDGGSGGVGVGGFTGGGGGNLGGGGGDLGGGGNGFALAAAGGMMGYAVGGGLGSLGSYSDGGRLLKGPGDGVSDSIPATIGRKQQPARLADGEFVVPARIVSELGNGSTDAGAKKLYAMMDRVQRARGKTTGKNKVAANSRADKYLPA